MRGARARGHEVIGACAEGPLLAAVRAEGFRVVDVPFARRVSPPPIGARCGAGRAAAGGTAGPRACAHADQRLPRPPGGAHRGRAGDRLYLPRLPVQPAKSLAAAHCLLDVGAAGGRITDRVPHRLQRRGRGCAAAAHCARPVAVGNGRDPVVFHPDAAARARIRTQLGVAPDRPVVIAVSRLVRHKGYPELARAMQGVPDAELWVVGERLASDRGPNMADVLREAGLGERLRMLGYREDVAALLAAADIFVLPSHFEGLPMSVIEAMLSGLPVVASDIRGPREQVVEGETGLLVPMGDAGALRDAIARLAADPDLRHRMGEAGRDRAVELFDETKTVAHALDALGL